MRSRIVKWGNSLALRIPCALVADLGLTVASRVDLRVRDGKLEVVPTGDGDLELERMLAGVTEENLHGECDTGKPVGREEC